MKKEYELEAWQLQCDYNAKSSKSGARKMYYSLFALGGGKYGIICI